MPSLAEVNTHHLCQTRQVPAQLSKGIGTFESTYSVHIYDIRSQFPMQPADEMPIICLVSLATCCARLSLTGELHSKAALSDQIRSDQTSVYGVRSLKGDSSITDCGVCGSSSGRFEAGLRDTHLPWLPDQDRRAITNKSHFSLACLIVLTTSKREREREEEKLGFPCRAILSSRV